MSKLKGLYDTVIRLYAQREDLFKKLGKETYLNWIMGIKPDSLVQFDITLKELDTSIENINIAIKELEYA